MLKGSKERSTAKRREAKRMVKEFKERMDEKIGRNLSRK